MIHKSTKKPAPKRTSISPVDKPASALFSPKILKEIIFFVFALAVSSVLLFLHYRSLTPRDFVFGFYYPIIAADPYFGYTGTEPAFGYRLLTSLLVYWLPFSLPQGFLIVNVFFLLLTSTALVYLCREFGLRGFLPFLAPIPYLYSTGIHWQLDCIWLQDPITHLCLCICIAAMLRSKDEWVSLFSCIGVLNRETALLLFPVWYLARFGWKIHRQSLVQSLWTWLPSILLFLAVRLVWHPLTIYHQFSDHLSIPHPGVLGFYWSEFLRLNPTFKVLLQRMFDPQLLRGFFGPLLPFFMITLLRGSTIFRKLSWLVLFSWLQVLIAYDIGRLETISFPVIIPAALWGIQHLIQKFPYSRWLELGFSLFLFLWPQSFLAGLILLGIVSLLLLLLSKLHAKGLFLFINKPNPPESTEISISPKIIEPWGNPTIPKFTRSVQTAFGGIVVIFLWFSYFCWETYSVQPKPIIWCPLSLLPGKQSFWELLQVKNNQLLHTDVTKETLIDKTPMLLGHPTDPDAYLAAMDPTQIITILCAYKAKVESGKFFTLGRFSFTAKKQLYLKPGFYMETFSNQVNFAFLPYEADTLGLYFARYPDPAITGSLSFVLYDASQLHSRRKGN